MQQLSNQLSLLALALVPSAMISCSRAEPDVGPTVEQDRDVEQQDRLEVGDYRNLTADERRDYDIDREYLRSLAPPNRAISLNLADPQQLRFVVTVHG